jgi:hypothetical protein
MNKRIKTYSAIDLLDKVFEFTEMTPNSSEWNIKSLRSNPPRQIRLRQIESLLTAFGIITISQGLLGKAKSIFSITQTIPIKEFLRGDFIWNRSIAEYSGVIQHIKGFVKNKDGDYNRERDINLAELAFIFPTLINFKRKIRDILTFNSGWLEASSEVSLFSIYLSNSIAENLVGKYEELDNVIEQFINPKGLTFAEQELVDKFNFPTEDLSGIDIDFT